MDDLDLYCHETLQDERQTLITPPSSKQISSATLTTPGKYVICDGSTMVSMSVYDAAFEVFLFDLCTALGGSTDASDGVDFQAREVAYWIVMT